MWLRFLRPRLSPSPISSLMHLPHHSGSAGSVLFSLAISPSSLLLSRYASTVGIVGLPNAGKSTLFNALTQSYRAQTGKYPFTTIEPNKALVFLPDARLEALAKKMGSLKTMKLQCEFVDIAGLVRDAHKGHGLGNQFLSNIRGVDVILQVLRCFDRDDVSHVEASIDPVRDMAIIENELILADMTTIEKRLEVLSSRKFKKGTDRMPPEEEQKLLKRAEEILMEGILLSRVRWDNKDYALLKESNLLTIKPLAYILNLSPEDIAINKGLDNPLVRKTLARFQELQAAMDRENLVTQSPSTTTTTTATTTGKASNKNSECSDQPGNNKIHHAILSACLEEEIANELETEEAKKDYRKEYGIVSSGLEQVGEVCCNILSLNNYYTLGPEEARSWRIPRGATAHAGAAKIHSDIALGFICAEICKASDFLEHGQNATKRKEGKTYVLQDGDIVLYRFNITKGKK
eukprot:gb/GEZN01007807.1/.p1 GENE.gb/GEZN01007807.1/~~gb/GEZN01007807.1/.p1  ORF type:complete len:462 (+),score=65.54 gb/GEZN01007807.1/:38-1423(+)